MGTDCKPVQGEIIIYDMVGKIVQQISVSSTVNHVMFNLNHSLSSGTYRVVLSQNNQILETQKLSIFE